MSNYSLKAYKQKVVIGSVIVVALISIVMVFIALNEHNEEAENSLVGLNDAIPESENNKDNINIKMTRNIEVPETDNQGSMEEGIDELTPYSNNEIVENKVDPYDTIYNDIEALKAGDQITTIRYFGDSDTFTSDIVADKLAATLITFISSEEREDDSTEVIVHVCALDYNLMKDDSEKLKVELSTENSEETLTDTVNKELAKNVVDGKYDVHYNIPVTVQDGLVKVTEELKQAITGNWYSGMNVELQTVNCILDESITILAGG